jgi:sortase (surface protein transpeptidase)
MRGAFVWESVTDAEHEYAFATRVRVYLSSCIVNYTDTAVLNAVGREHTLTPVTCSRLIGPGRVIVQAVEVGSAKR